MEYSKILVRKWIITIEPPNTVGPNLKTYRMTNTQMVINIERELETITLDNDGE